MTDWWTPGGGFDEFENIENECHENNLNSISIDKNKVTKRAIEYRKCPYCHQSIPSYAICRCGEIYLQGKTDAIDECLSILASAYMNQDGVHEAYRKIEQLKEQK